ncbi:hypothetical protein LOZ66_006501 [Ophidiomyces ophidiicola]|nr:hypothetical protein LOZ66_006501 [Ophidiomyces ophidiicola]
MESTLTLVQGINDQPAFEISCSAVSNPPVRSGDLMAEPFLGVEPWMQEMLNDHIFSSPELCLDHIHNPCAAADSDLASPAITMDESWINSNTWQGHGDFDFAQGKAADHITSDLPPSITTDSSFLADNTLGNMPAFDVIFAEKEPDFLSTTRPYSDLQADHSNSAFNHVATAFRELARARAAADSRPVPQQQKQRDASIALYLERLRDACNDAVAVINSSSSSNRSDNESSFSSPSLGSPLNSFHNDQISTPWEPNSTIRGASSTLFDQFIVNETNSQQSSPGTLATSYRASLSTPASEASSRQQTVTHTPVTGGVELVMDLNMNTATTLPRRHRPRTQAQRERYLAVRNRGACEKHKKQHKRCTCVDKDISLDEHTKRATSNRPGYKSNHVLLATRSPVPITPPTVHGPNRNAECGPHAKTHQYTTPETEGLHSRFVKNAGICTPTHSPKQHASVQKTPRDTFQTLDSTKKRDSAHDLDPVSERTKGSSSFRCRISDHHTQSGDATPSALLSTSSPETTSSVGRIANMRVVTPMTTNAKTTRAYLRATSIVRRPTEGERIMKTAASWLRHEPAERGCASRRFIQEPRTPGLRSPNSGHSVGKIRQLPIQPSYLTLGCQDLVQSSPNIIGESPSHTKLLYFCIHLISNMVHRITLLIPSIYCTTLFCRAACNRLDLICLHSSATLNKSRQRCWWNSYRTWLPLWGLALLCEWLWVQLMNPKSYYL